MCIRLQSVYMSGVFVVTFSSRQAPLSVNSVSALMYLESISPVRHVRGCVCFQGRKDELSLLLPRRKQDQHKVYSSLKPTGFHVRYVLIQHTCTSNRLKLLENDNVLNLTKTV